MVSGADLITERKLLGCLLRFSRYWEHLLSYLVYGLVLALANVILAAPPVNIENNYKDALSLFEQRDILSLHKAVSILEGNLQADANHLATQALLGFAYAHEAYLMQQLGEPSKDYQASAEAFAKAVLAKQPTNIFARKTVIYLNLASGLQAEAIKILQKEITEKETDPDMWYMQAIISDGEKSMKSLAKALELKPNHVWIYSDMAFRAIQLNNIPLAEKWVVALETRAPGIADTDLIRAVIASQRKDKKAAQQHWDAFSKKAQNAPTFSRLKDILSKKK